MPKYIKILLLKSKDQEKAFEITRRERRVVDTFGGALTQLTAAFLPETAEPREKRHNMFKGPKGKNRNCRILYPIGISLRNES